MLLVIYQFEVTVYTLNPTVKKSLTPLIILANFMKKYMDKCVSKLIFTTLILPNNNIKKSYTVKCQGREIPTNKRNPEIAWRIMPSGSHIFWFTINSTTINSLRMAVDVIQSRRATTTRQPKSQMTMSVSQSPQRCARSPRSFDLHETPLTTVLRRYHVTNVTSWPHRKPRWTACGRRRAISAGGRGWTASIAALSWKNRASIVSE